jgi:hypothetical protein
VAGGGADPGAVDPVEPTLGPRELGAAGLARLRGGLRALSDFNPHEWRILAPLMFVGFFEVMT